MRGVFSCFIVTVAALVGLLVAVASPAVFALAYAQEKSDADVAQHLCAGSPWTGTWENVNAPAFNGTWELTFSCTGGKLRATLFGTGPLTSSVQEVSSLRIEAGVVKFQTQAGPRLVVDYELVLNEEGKLVGKGLARTSTIKVSLSPTKK